MDENRFDALSRALSVAGSRRRAVAVGLASALGLRGAVNREGATAKKKCPPCKKRKNGKCKKRKPDGTECPGGSCQGGQCVAAAATLPPAPPCSEAANGTACGSAGQCIAGRCAEPCGTACQSSCNNYCPNTVAPSVFFCGRDIPNCEAAPTPCVDHGDCGANELCTATYCLPINGNTNRCQALCGT